MNSLHSRDRKAKMLTNKHKQGSKVVLNTEYRRLTVIDRNNSTVLQKAPTPWRSGSLQVVIMLLKNRVLINLGIQTSRRSCTEIQNRLAARP